MISIDAAHKEVNDLYKQLTPMVDAVVNKNCKEIDDIVGKIKSNLTVLTKKELEDYMLRLTAEAYYLTSTKDSSILKQECALTLLKEKQADVFNITPGTARAKDNQSIIDTVDKQVVTLLYNAVTNRLKSKLDETHRMINVLSNVLISKNAEAKLRGGIRDNDTYDNSL